MKKTISKQKLSLNKETLSKLNNNEMTQVNGGIGTVGLVCHPRQTFGAGCETNRPPGNLC